VLRRNGRVSPTSAPSWFAAIPVALLAGYAYAQMFWSMAPVPSGRYPATAIYWPVDVINTVVWVTRPIGIFQPLWILEAFIVTAGLDLVAHFAGLPLSSNYTMALGAIVKAISSQIECFTGIKLPTKKYFGTATVCPFKF